MDEEFAALLTQALKQIKRREGKNLALIQDELGYALGRDSGGSVIEYWRKGNQPAALSDLETLCQEIQRRTQFDAAWCSTFLHSGGHPYPEQACQQIFTAAEAPASLQPALRAPTSDFTGRQDVVDSITQLLASAPAAAPIVAIRGMGGVGKTELAYRLAQQLQAAYPDGQIMLALHGTAAHPRTALDVLQQCLFMLQPSAGLIQDRDVLQARYTSLLSTRRMVIIADDAADAEQVQPLIPPPGSALLITTRRRFSLPGMQSIDLEMLAPVAARELVLSICPRIGQHADALAHSCGYLPLALRISASELANDDTQSVSAYLQRLSDENMRLQLLRAADSSLSDVASSLNLSVATLPAPAQSALFQLGVLTGSFDLEAATAILDAVPDVPATLGLLRRHNLVQYDPLTQRFSLHDLVRALALLRLADPRPVWLRYAAHYAQVADAADTLYQQGGSAVEAALSTFDRERLHIGAAWRWLQQQPAADDTDALALEFVHNTIYIGDLRFNSRSERIPQLTHGLAAAQRLAQRHSQRVCSINLGRAYFQLREFATAIEYFQAGLELARADRRHHVEANALDNLGQAYILLNRLDAAKECLEAAVTIARTGENRFCEASSLNNLGVVCLRQGQLLAARAFLTQALAAIREVGYRRGEAWSLSYVALVQAAEHNHHAAEQTLHTALQIARQLADQSAEVQILAYLGWVTLLDADLESAREYLEAAAALNPACSAPFDQEWINGKLALLWFRWGDERHGLELHSQRMAAVVQHPDWDSAEECRLLGQWLLQRGDERGSRVFQRWIDYQTHVNHADRERDHAFMQRMQSAGQAATVPEQSETS